MREQLREVREPVRHGGLSGGGLRRREGHLRRESEERRVRPAGGAGVGASLSTRYVHKSRELRCYVDLLFQSCHQKWQLCANFGKTQVCSFSLYCKELLGIVNSELYLIIAGR